MIIKLVTAIKARFKASTMSNNLYIGLMTGTSLDGIDYALTNITKSSLKVLDTGYLDYSTQLRNTIRKLRNSKGKVYLDDVHSCTQEIAVVASQLIESRLAEKKFRDSNIIAIGYQGQTIHHHPQPYNRYSYQLNPAIAINAITAIPVVSDFRQTDIALGGQGAPLTPAFHRHFFWNDTEMKVVLNIGGIANATLLDKQRNKPIVAFDTGPGNTLIDEWCQKEFGKLYDENGKLARNGKLIKKLLNTLMKDAYFRKEPPKSTGQEYFNLDWLMQYMGNDKTYVKTDVLNTLTELTAYSCAKSIIKYQPQTKNTILCGGGSKNEYLVERLSHHLPGVQLSLSNKYGLAYNYVESVAFAYFAFCNINRIKTDLRSTTGSKEKTILGSYVNCYQ